MIRITHSVKLYERFYKEYFLHRISDNSVVRVHRDRQHQPHPTGRTVQTVVQHRRQCFSGQQVFPTKRSIVK